jgi:Domain of unknown function (DUF4157)
MFMLERRSPLAKPPEKKAGDGRKPPDRGKAGALRLRMAAEAAKKERGPITEERRRYFESKVTRAASREGHPLDPGARQRMERTTGANLSDVRVHTDTNSQEAAADLGARAFTLGREIYFADGQYQPGTRGGDALLAHELAHTLQDGPAGPSPDNGLEFGTRGDRDEVEADRFARSVAAGTPEVPATTRTDSSRPVVHLDEKPGAAPAPPDVAPALPEGATPTSAAGPTTTPPMPSGPETVILNDAAQQEALLPKPDLEEIFDNDLADDIEVVATTRAEHMAEARAKKEHDELVRAARKNVEAEIARLSKESKGKGPTKAEKKEMLETAVAGVAKPDLEAVKVKVEGEELAKLRATFLEKAGDILFVRGGGTWNNLKKELKTKEAALVKKLSTATKKKPASSALEIQEEVLKLRDTYPPKLDAKLEELKAGFKILAENQARFDFEEQKGVSWLKDMKRPAAGREPVVKVKDTGGLITGTEKMKGEEPVAASVVEWVKHLKKSSPVPFSASTYLSHSWGEYSLDIFLGAKMDDRGYYEQAKAVAFLLAADASAAATGVEWMALYTDFDVAKKVNETLGKRRVGFQWQHGPAPYVLHIHFDIKPKSFPEPTAPPAPEEEPVCRDPSDLVCR